MEVDCGMELLKELQDSVAWRSILGNKLIFIGSNT